MGGTSGTGRVGPVLLQALLSHTPSARKDPDPRTDEGHSSLPGLAQVASLRQPGFTDAPGVGVMGTAWWQPSVWFLAPELAGGPSFLLGGQGPSSLWCWSQVDMDSNPAWAICQLCANYSLLKLPLRRL